LSRGGAGSLEHLRNGPVRAGRRNTPRRPFPESGQETDATPVNGVMERGQPAARGRAMGAGLGIPPIAAGSVLLLTLTASSRHIAGIILIVAGVLVLLSAWGRAMLSSGRPRISWVSPTLEPAACQRYVRNTPVNALTRSLRGLRHGQRSHRWGRTALAGGPHVAQRREMPSAVIVKEAGREDP
jgi:hypothetical protein